MFEFFEGLIEKLGVKLIGDFTDKLVNFITDIKKNSTDKNNDEGKNSAKIGSSGYYAKIGSSGDYAQIGSSGYSAKIGSSGDYAQIGSSGDYAQIGSSGYSAKIGSSGYYAKIGSSGNYAQIGSSGYYAKIGSSGYYAKIGSSGDYAQIGSSGYSAQIDISGTDSIGFGCGWKTLIKAKKGTWISLAEYGKKVVNDITKIVPIFALSAQVGNTDYRDYKNRILKEDEYYCLYNKRFHPVNISDGLKIIENSKKIRDGIIIIKGVNMDDLLDDDVEEIYLVKEGKISAHGYTLREAIDDLTFKKMKNIDISEIVKEIKKTNKVTRSQYRAITGACSYGTNKFCEQHKIEELEEIELDELRKILVNDYGAEKFWKLIDNK